MSQPAFISGREPATNVHSASSPVRARVIGDPAVALRVQVMRDGAVWPCDCLESPVPLMLPLTEGDEVVVLPPEGGNAGVVLGRVRPYVHEPVRDTLSLAASRSMRLQCGAASIDMRADGKVVIRGDDVLVHAKSTKRIRAGSVSIN